MPWERCFGRATDGIRQERYISVNSPLWKRVIAWERSHAASGHGIILGDADRNKKEEFSAECHSVDCSGDSKVLTELQIAIKSRLLF